MLVLSKVKVTHYYCANVQWILSSIEQQMNSGNLGKTSNTCVCVIKMIHYNLS